MLKLYRFACAIGLMSSLANQAVAKPDFYEFESDVDQDSISLRHRPEVDATSTLAAREMTSQTGALKNRPTYLPTIVREAEASGIPPAIADAVVRVESQYLPEAVGRAGEIGLMQVLPTTAAYLGFSGSSSELAEPETNIRLGVKYLATAWRLSGGDLCRALMKYRAGHSSIEMTRLDREYCRRARLHLASTGMGPWPEAENDSPKSRVRVARERPATGAKHVAAARASRPKFQRPYRVAGSSFKSRGLASSQYRRFQAGRSRFVMRNVGVVRRGPGKQFRAFLSPL